MGKAMYVGTEGTELVTTEVNLYNYGDECTDITGGWVQQGFQVGSGTFTKNSDHIFMQGSAETTLTAMTVNKINLADYNTLNFEVEYSDTIHSNGHFIYGGVNTTANTYPTAGTIAPVRGFVSSYVNGVLSLDISDVTEELYIFAMNGRWTSGTGTLKVKRVWLETEVEVPTSNHVARKVKQPFVEEILVARKVKNGWVEVDNVARKFFLNLTMADCPYALSWLTPSSSSTVTINNSAHVVENDVLRFYINATGSGSGSTNRACGITIKNAGGKKLSFSYNLVGSFSANTYTTFYVVYYTSSSGWIQTALTGSAETGGYVNYSATLPSNAAIVNIMLEFKDRSGTRESIAYIKDLVVDGVEIIPYLENGY